MQLNHAQLHQALGAQILQTSLARQPLFYVSPSAKIHTEVVRGGVPIIFPQFGLFGDLAKHGYARHLTWTLLTEESTTSGSRVHYHAVMDQTENPLWSNVAELSLISEVEADIWTCELSIKNIGMTDFEFGVGLHPYFACDNVQEVEVKLLQSGVNLGFSAQGRDTVLDSSDDIHLIMPQARYHLSSQGFSQWIVWNPGEDGVHNFKDMPSEDWCKFVCVEPANASHKKVLAQNETFVGSMKVQRILGE